MHSNVCLKLLCDAKFSFFLIFPVEIWNENNIIIPVHSGIICFWISLFGGAAYQRGEEAEERKAALKINLCLISLRWYNVEKLTVLGSSNLNLSFSGTQQKVKKMKGKCVTFCFITVYAKVSPKSSGEWWVFYIEVRSLYSKLIFTHFVSCWNRSHEIMKKSKTRDYHQKLNVRVASRIAKWWKN